MNPLRVAGWALRGPLALLVRFSQWKPFLILAGVQTAFLVILVSFHTSLIAPFGVPLTKLLGGPNAAHYPWFFYFLPEMFRKALLVLNVLVASVLFGVATLYFARAFGFPSKSGPGIWRGVWRSAPLLIVVSLVESLLLLGASSIARWVPQEAMLNSGLVRWGVRFGLMAVMITIQCFLLYTTAWIVLMKSNLLGAFRDSIRVAARTFLPTFVIAAVPAVILFPVSYLGSRPDLIASKFKPELIATVLGGQVLLQTVLAFFLVGAATRLFIWRTEAAR
ncbi:MAG: hypothetical protein ACE15D_07730 [Candidatus Eisenbacteria bacterium]